MFKSRFLIINHSRFKYFIWCTSTNNCVPLNQHQVTMRNSIKMYVLVLVTLCVVLYQYHMTKFWPPMPTELKINDEPILYIITPTYYRAEQIAELTRLSHTLMLVPNVYWLVIEDANTTSQRINNLLVKSGIRFHHMTAPMPAEFRRKKIKPRGVSNRNKGLSWIRNNARSGVLYFADDDNTYDLQLFQEIRYTKRVSMFPVGLVTKLGVSTPIVRNGQFDGFYDGWQAGRKFPVDMAGFAVSVKFLLSRPNAKMPFKPGYEEDGFLRSLAPLEPATIELLASNCTQIYVWHTQSKKNDKSLPLDTKYDNTNLVELKKNMF